MGNILVMPIGSVDRDVLASIAAAAGKAFQCAAEPAESIPVPEKTYNARRRQYNSTRMLKALEMRKPEKYDFLLGVIDEDLYVPELNFVFGEADIIAGIAVIGLPRLRQKFYGLEQDEGLFLKRAAKEAIHELGHLKGLSHCPDRKCVMHFSNSLEDTDIKEAGFCSKCKHTVSKYFREGE